MSALHLDSLEIKNFRCFEHLVIEKLGRVNLIVGKNSVGKTSLLEAVNLYATQAPPHQLYLTLLERAAVFPKQSENVLTFDLLSSLFYGQQNTVGATIELGPIGNEISRISIRTVYCIEDSDNAPRLKEVDPSFGSQLDDVSIGVRIAQGQRHGRIFRLPLLANPVHHMALVNIPVNNCDIIHSDGVNPGLMPLYWDALLLEGQETEVTDLLKIIDPDIERIYMITSSDSPFGRIPFVKTRKLERPIQLNSHGDGIRRLFGFALMLVRARNSYLLIDEFENGLHHDIQITVWRHIFRLANESNIQVFATTHSWDCVEAFQEAAAEEQNRNAMLIRLQKKRDGTGIEAVLYDERRLTIATEENIEVR